jgi:hypothetical protein
MQTKSPTRPTIVWVLIFLLGFLALNALAAGAAFLLAPDGHLIQMPLSQLDRTPFSNFLLPGLLLFTFNGLFPLAVAYSLWKLPAWSWPNSLNPFKRYHWSWAGSLASGAILIIWIIVQIQWIQIGVLHFICLVLGALIMLLTLPPAVRRYCSEKGRHRLPA